MSVKHEDPPSGSIFQSLHCNFMFCLRDQTSWLLASNAGHLHFKIILFGELSAQVSFEGLRFRIALMSEVSADNLRSICTVKGLRKGDKGRALP